jgi:fatty acid desaturase
LLRYKIDIIAIVTVLLTVSLQVCGVVFGWPWYLVFPIVLLVRQVSIIQHNHAHLGIFCSGFLNKSFGRLCSLSNGVLPEFYELHHIRNHHPFNQCSTGEKQDWSSLYAFNGTHFPDQPMGRVYYVLTFPFIALSHCVIEMAHSPGTSIARRFLITSALALPTLGCLIWIDARHFILFLGLPWTAVAFGLGYNNHTTHYGCKYEHRFDMAVDDLALPFRFFGYNQGYHLEHHLKPTLHWSLLPGFHESIKQEIPARNIRPQFGGFGGHQFPEKELKAR